MLRSAMKGLEFLSKCLEGSGIKIPKDPDFFSHISLDKKLYFECVLFNVMIAFVFAN
jgi:hypothetical protein